MSQNISPAVEADYLDFARTHNSYLFRVVADHPEGGRGRVSHYVDQDRDTAFGRALDLAFCYRATNGAVEEIDLHTGEARVVVGDRVSDAQARVEG